MIAAFTMGIAALPAARAADPTPKDGSVFPFPPVPSASIAGPTLQESKHVRRAEPNHLPADAPNILIILLDDVSYGLPSTFGGEIQTPNLTRLANVPHDVDLLADPGRAFDRPQPPGTPTRMSGSFMTCGMISRRLTTSPPRSRSV
jgi:hypothetical protein